MADEVDKTPSPFDVKTVRHLVALMSRHDLSEIDLREGDLRIRLRRGPHGRGALPGAGDTPTPNSISGHVPGMEANSPQAGPASAKEIKTIKSLTPGTFYAAPSPDAEPFVRVGSRVAPDTVVCIIEAMKIFNEITADCSGVISKIVAQNQQAVEYGQVLFEVDPAG